MKLIQLLQEIDDQRLDDELGDYHLVGKWGEKEKSHSFRHATDRRMIQHPTSIQKAFQKFGRTEHNLNFYFVNLPGAAKHSESGFMEPEVIAKTLPKAWPEIAARSQEARHENAINVIFVGNVGANRIPMTPWIMAHRIGHAIQATSRFFNFNQAADWTGWLEYEGDFIDFMRNILDDVYNWQLSGGLNFWGFSSGSQDKLLAKFFEAIGTMRSTRQGNLGGRPYEFLYELFAQHIIQG